MEKFRPLQGTFSFSCEYMQQYGVITGNMKQQRIW